MKFLSVAVVVALVAFTCAVPVQYDEEASDDLTLQDVRDALESLDLLEVSASESQLYFLDKVKRAIKRGVRIDIRIRPASAELDTESGLSPEEVKDLLQALESLEASAASDNTYGWLKKKLKKVGRAIEKVGKKVLERGIPIPIPISAASAELDTESELSDEELKELLEAFESLETSDNTYGWLKKKLKKVGRALEKVGKKVLERGIPIPIPISATSAELDTESDLSAEELKELLQAFESLEASDKTYGWLKKKLRKVGRALEKVGKKVLERGIPIPINAASAELNTESDLSAEELKDLLEAFESLEASDNTYGWLKKKLRKVGRAIEKGAKKALEGPIPLPPIPI